MATPQRTTRKVKLQVWLTPEEHQLLSQVATETGQGMSSYVRSAVMRAIKTDKGSPNHYNPY
ncbi:MULTISPECIES: plasmid mobilization protein [Nostocales]|uniref:plasmid mobilization protein n=1 Tax=Nostocales TaxID=1161 RepID=UPI00049643D3